jgi:hypothetical protein
VESDEEKQMIMEKNLYPFVLVMLACLRVDEIISCLICEEISVYVRNGILQNLRLLSENAANLPKPDRIENCQDSESEDEAEAEAPPEETPKVLWDYQTVTLARTRTNLRNLVIGTWLMSKHESMLKLDLPVFSACLQFLPFDGLTVNILQVYSSLVSRGVMAEFPEFSPPDDHTFTIEALDRIIETNPDFEPSGVTQNFLSDLILQEF